MGERVFQVRERNVQNVGAGSKATHHMYENYTEKPERSQEEAGGNEPRSHWGTGNMDSCAHPAPGKASSALALTLGGIHLLVCSKERPGMESGAGILHGQGIIHALSVSIAPRDQSPITRAVRQQL